MSIGSETVLFNYLSDKEVGAPCYKVWQWPKSCAMACLIRAYGNE